MPELLLLLQLPHCRGSEGGGIAASEVHRMSTKINDILDSAVSKQVDNTACILAYLFLILLPGSVMKSGLPSFPFFRILRIPFLLVRLAFMIASTGHWQRITNNPYVDCPTL